MRYGVSQKMAESGIQTQHLWLFNHGDAHTYLILKTLNFVQYFREMEKTPTTELNTCLSKKVSIKKLKQTSLDVFCLNFSIICLSVPTMEIIFFSGFWNQGSLGGKMFDIFRLENMIFFSFH